VEFKVGDEVTFIGKKPSIDYGPNPSMRGTAVVIMGTYYGARFNCAITNGHDLDGRVEKGNGWFGFVSCKDGVLKAVKRDWREI
jgi:hypothetical protein